MGDAAVSLWVVDGNGRAQAFYRRHGFAQDPEHLKRHDETGALEPALRAPGRGRARVAGTSRLGHETAWSLVPAASRGQGVHVLLGARSRHAPAQAVLVALLSAVVAATAAAGPALARASEESVQHRVLVAATQADRGVAVNVQAERPPAPTSLAARLRPATSGRPWVAPVGGATADGLVRGRTDVLVPVVARDGVCEHLVVTAGRCTQGAGEAVVSRSTAQALGLEVGARLDVADAGTGDDTGSVLRGVRVVGLSDPVDASSAYWFDRPQRADAPAGERCAGRRPSTSAGGPCAPAPGARSPPPSTCRSTRRPCGSRTSRRPGPG
ncbi:hypothetical protein GCM10025868_39140 [Angustibacter aerolatus]|uniref:N-acetyltransferase domain-containing protein n=1 Tax=Angustibacter aerolatus TaxID=1162965 RepID=A0ABQ6JLA7_9ACTN|nr:hypothetical protein GCM10025868_39140 [Angustibacter aerolatus]